MLRWRFYGITDECRYIRIDNPDVPVVCSVELAKQTAARLSLSYKKRDGFSGEWFRHCRCECVSDSGKSFEF